MKADKDQPKLANVIHFVPNKWGQVQKFANFYRMTYRFSSKADLALSGIMGHFYRYNVLIGLSKRLAPELDKEYKESIERGYSDTVHSEELAAIVDSLFCELYSVVDCTRTVIAFVYKNHKCVPTDSTSKLFEYAAIGKKVGKKVKSLVYMDERVPLEIRNALAEGHNDWFPILKKIRDEINHSSVGFCSDFEGRLKGELEPKISYFHSGLANIEGNVLVTDDVFKMLSEYEKKINRFLWSVFKALNQTLEDKETEQFCGIFDGRIYKRFVSPHGAVDSHSGRCKSREWFEKEKVNRNVHM